MAHTKIKSFVYDGIAWETAEDAGTCGDGLIIYYREGSPDWIAADNAGQTFSSFGYSLLDDARDNCPENEAYITAAKAADENITERVSRNAGDETRFAGYGDQDAMIEAGWAKAEWFDGGRLFQPSEEE